MIHFDDEICANLDKASEREWLETNALGGFASSTITGLNTRRYHGLLVAATRPPVGRLMLLAKLEETLVIDGQRYDLSVNQYPNTVHPQGYQYLKAFRLAPFPTFIYEVGEARIIKTVFMLDGENTTVIQYEWQTVDAATVRQLPPRTVQLEVHPLIAFRDYHSTTHENPSLNAHVEMQPQLASLTPYQGLPTLHLAHDADFAEASGFWYRHFEYALERQRGLDFIEDLFNPLVLKFDLTKRPSANVMASIEAPDINRVDEFKDGEIKRRKNIVAAPPVANQLVTLLTQAANQFIVARGNHKTVLAGYHWFSDWGRDTMIALPGLLYAMPSLEAAKSILLEFAQHADQGMLPNRFPEADDEPEYNTIDATLWFFEAIRALTQRSGDYQFVKTKLYAVLLDIIKWHVQGTRYGIKVDADGMLTGGVDGVQLTWMDAKVGDFVVTPRHGKAVEIQALWYNALCVMQDFARRFKDSTTEPLCRELAALAKANFGKAFWNAESDCLFDVINGDAKDAAIRPNQIFAVSLPHSMLSGEEARRVVAVVERELLTPFGLRSLAPSDIAYRPVYAGDAYSRDTAYHQGTVWAWLLGPFITAYVKVNNGAQKSREVGEKLLTGFCEHLHEAGLGQVSEIFDGDAPHRPRGCIAQAWSVAELLRAACEEVFQVQAKSGEINKALR
ncbi:MAG: glycogen debranching enzyme N-terminal domain-containing protein [Acidobacteria bacterium]|nr:glycogen debranching enzyme N-terminal domain-containing protein [Acidobacteriota bacterium]